MPLGDYLVGVSYLAATLGGVLFATSVVVSRRLAHISGAAGVIAYAIVATLGLIAVHVLPLCIGVLSRPAVLAAAMLAAAASLLVRPARASANAAQAAEPSADPPASHTGERVSWLIAALAIGGVVIVELGYVWRHVADSPGGIDALTFHAPGVARWMQLKSLWQIDQFVPALAHGNYPNSGDVVLLSAMLPWNDDFLMRVVFLPFLALTGVAVYALAREFRAPAPTAAVFAAMTVALPNVALDVTSNMLPDVIMFFSFAGGVLFLLRQQRTRRRSELVLAGLSLGLAFGTKWFGVSSVLATLVVWAGASTIACRGVGAVARKGVALLGLIGATGGIWLLRNLLESGNPVFPQKVALLGLTIFYAPRDRLRELGGFTIANYFDRPGIWRSYLIPAFERALGLPGAVIGACFLLAAAVAVREWRRRSPRGDQGRVVAVAAGVAVLAAVYALTPFTAFGPKGMPFLAFANVRYAVPAMLVAAALGAWAAARVGNAHTAVELAALAAVVEGLDRGLGIRLGGEELALTAIIAAGAVAAIMYRRARPGGALRPAVVWGLALVSLGAIAVGYPEQRSYNRARFSHADPSFDWIAVHAPAGHRVGLANIWTTAGPSPVLAMFGPRLRNRVVYVGRFVHGMLRQYERPDDFVGALRHGRYDLLLIGRGAPPARMVREQAWARAAGFSEVASSPRFTLYALSGLQPRAR